MYWVEEESCNSRMFNSCGPILSTKLLLLLLLEEGCEWHLQSSLVRWSQVARNKAPKLNSPVGHYLEDILRDNSWGSSVLFWLVRFSFCLCYIYWLDLSNFR